jgi:hypothetical protein
MEPTGTDKQVNADEENQACPAVVLDGGAESAGMNIYALDR